jgi:hypothetical protein
MIGSPSISTFVVARQFVICDNANTRDKDNSKISFLRICLNMIEKDE